MGSNPGYTLDGTTETTLKGHAFAVIDSDVPDADAARAHQTIACSMSGAAMLKGLQPAITSGSAMTEVDGSSITGYLTAQGNDDSLGMLYAYLKGFDFNVVDAPTAGKVALHDAVVCPASATYTYASNTWSVSVGTPPLAMGELVFDGEGAASSLVLASGQADTSPSGDRTLRLGAGTGVNIVGKIVVAYTGEDDLTAVACAIVG